MTDQPEDALAQLTHAIERAIERGVCLDVTALARLEQLTREQLMESRTPDRLRDSELEALLYHGLSSGTSTPAFVRDKIVKAVQELQTRRADDVRRKIAEDQAFGGGPITEGQIDGMLRWAEEIDLPIYAQVIGPRAARELRAHRGAVLSVEDQEALRDARGSVAGSPHPGMERTEQLRALNVIDRILSGKVQL